MKKSHGTHKKRQFVKYAIIQLQCQEIKSDPFGRTFYTRFPEGTRNTTFAHHPEIGEQKMVLSDSYWFFSFILLYGFYGVFFFLRNHFIYTYILYKSYIPYLQKILSFSASCLCKRAHRILILDYVMFVRGSTWGGWCFNLLSKHRLQK